MSSIRLSGQGHPFDKFFFFDQYGENLTNVHNEIIKYNFTLHIDSFIIEQFLRSLVGSAWQNSINQSSRNTIKYHGECSDGKNNFFIHYGVSKAFSDKDSFSTYDFYQIGIDASYKNPVSPWGGSLGNVEIKYGKRNSFDPITGKGKEVVFNIHLIDDETCKNVNRTMKFLKKYVSDFYTSISSHLIDLENMTFLNFDSSYYKIALNSVNASLFKEIMRFANAKNDYESKLLKLQEEIEQLNEQITNQQNTINIQQKDIQNYQQTIESAKTNLTKFFQEKRANSSSSNDSIESFAELNQLIKSTCKVQ